MVGLDRVCSLLPNHVDGVLDAAVGNDGNHGSVGNTQVLNTVDLELGVHDTLLDVFGQSRRTAGVERGLATVENRTLHLRVRFQGHIPGVLGLDERAEGFGFDEDVVAEADTLAHGKDVEVVGEEVEVDVGLLEGVGAVEGHRARFGDRAHQVDDNGQVLALLGRREMPLEGAAEHADEVQLEVGLALRGEGVLATVGGLGLAVFLVLLEVVIDPGEADQLEKTGPGGTGVVLLVGLDGGLVLGGLAQEDVVHTVTILDLEDKWHTRVVDEVLADVAGVDDGVDAVALQLAGGAHAAQHEQLGGLEDPLGQDDLTAGVEVQLIARGVNDGHAPADAVRVVDDEALGVHFRNDGDVGLVLHEEEAARPHTLVDTVGAVGEAIHFTVIDVLRDGTAFLRPRLGDGFTERLHLIEKLSVGDVDGAPRTDLRELLGVQIPVVVVGCALTEVRHEGVPGPFLASVFLPPVKGRLAAGHPGEVVQRRAPTKRLTPRVGLLDAFVVVTLDQGGLVRPVVLAVPELHGFRGRGDLLVLMGVANTSLDDEDGHIGVFGQTTSDSVTSGTTAHDDEVIVGVVLGRCHGGGEDHNE